MTRPTSAKSSSLPETGSCLGIGESRARARDWARARAHRGFTLFEMLVVVAILILLVGILLPAVTSAWRSADRSRTAIDLQAIATALDQYKADFGDYPRLSPVTAPAGDTRTGYGAWLLMRALLSPGAAADTDPNLKDGKDGPGFHIRDGGKVYGPYILPDRFIIDDDDNRGTSVNWAGACIHDRGERPILYYPAARSMPKISSVSPPGFINPNSPIDYTLPPTALFNFADNNFPQVNSNAATEGFIDLAKFQKALGDRNNDGAINASTSDKENARSTGPFLLWSAGPDGLFGTDDDVVNFQ